MSEVPLHDGCTIQLTPMFRGQVRGLCALPLCQQQQSTDASRFHREKLTAASLCSDDVFRCRAVEPSSVSNVILRRARPGLAGLRLHSLAVLEPKIDGGRGRERADVVPGVGFRV